MITRIIRKLAPAYQSAVKLFAFLLASWLAILAGIFLTGLADPATPLPGRSTLTVSVTIALLCGTWWAMRRNGVLLVAEQWATTFIGAQALPWFIGRLGLLPTSTEQATWAILTASLVGAIGGWALAHWYQCREAREQGVSRGW